jgi:DNA-binding XRE family transcriptional regulator
LTVVERISAAMKRLGLTDAQVAKRMGVSRGAVHHWRTDRAVRPKYVLRLAEVLKLEPYQVSPYALSPVPPDKDGNTNIGAYLCRIDNTMSQIAEDIGLLKTRVASLETRFASLERAMHYRLDSIQKQLDQITACARLDRRRGAPGSNRG